MITGRQVRSGRALLKWGQWRLAKAAGISTRMLVPIENDEAASPGVLAKLSAALDAAGVDLTPDGGVAIRPTITLKASQIKAARALIGWERRKLAARSGLSGDTVMQAEINAAVSTQDLFAIQCVLQAAGCVFDGASGAASGVRLRKLAE